MQYIAPLTRLPVHSRRHPDAQFRHATQANVLNSHSASSPGAPAGAMQAEPDIAAGPPPGREAPGPKPPHPLPPLRPSELKFLQTVKIAQKPFSIR